MESKLTCPVPVDQIPRNEYLSMCNSWFFKWPKSNSKKLFISLLNSWLTILPIFLLIAYGNFNPSRNHIIVLLNTGIISLIFPLLLTIRLWIGWKYIHRRLIADNIEYEETGWYDGMIWKKPIAWKEQDLLIAQYQVNPILLTIRKSMIIISIAIFIGQIL